MNALSYPASAGPHPVGVSDAELRDVTYPTLRPGDADGRRMMARVWYPAATAEGERRPYFRAAEVDVAGAGLTGEPPLPPAEWMARLGGVLTHSLMDARPAAGPFPTLVYSHGALGYVGQNTPLMEHLASHGYVVWDVAHPGETGGIVYPDGDVLRADDSFREALNALGTDPATVDRLSDDVGKRFEGAGQQLDDRALGPWSRRWVHDIRALLDALEADALTPALPGVVHACDLSRVGTLGVSFGGAAACSAAQTDTRIAAAVNLDGGLYLSDLLDRDIRVPFLELATDSAAYFTRMGVPAHFLSYNEFFFEPLATAGSRADVVRLRISDVTHVELTDLVLLPREDRSRVLPGGAGAVEGARVTALVSTLVRGYFDLVLKQDDNGFPDRQLADLPEVERVDLAPIREWAAAR